MSEKHRPGRPRKIISGATLTRRLEVKLSNEDMRRLESLRIRTGHSMGKLVRDAINREFNRKEKK